MRAYYDDMVLDWITEIVMRIVITSTDIRNSTITEIKASHGNFIRWIDQSMVYSSASPPEEPYESEMLCTTIAWYDKQTSEVLVSVGGALVEHTIQHGREYGSLWGAPFLMGLMNGPYVLVKLYDPEFETCLSEHLKFWVVKVLGNYLSNPHPVEIMRLQALEGQYTEDLNSRSVSSLPIDVRLVT